MGVSLATKTINQIKLAILAMAFFVAMLPHLAFGGIGIDGSHIQTKHHIRINHNKVSFVAEYNYISSLIFNEKKLRYINKISFNGSHGGSFVTKASERNKVHEKFNSLNKYLSSDEPHQCNNKCHMTLKYPLKYTSTESSEETKASLDIAVFDDLGIELLRETLRAEIKYNSDINRPAFQWTYFTQKNGVLSIDLTEAAPKKEIEAKIIFHTAHGKKITPYSILNGRGIDANIPSGLKKMEVRMQYSITNDHKYQANVVLYDERDPFFVDTHHRWSHILTKGLLHNDMGVILQ